MNDRVMRKLCGEPRTFKCKIIEGKAVFQCPICLKVNTHSPEPGYRASHCHCWKGLGYVLEIDG